jgi:hypothetical protein
VAELGKELPVVRDRLYSSAMSLADFGLLDANLLKDCKKVTGYRATATDVFTLVAVFKQSWSQVPGKTPVTLEALSEAGKRAVELLAAFVVREQGPASASEAARLRQRWRTDRLRGTLTRRARRGGRRPRWSWRLVRSRR